MGDNTYTGYLREMYAHLLAVEEYASDVSPELFRLVGKERASVGREINRNTEYDMAKRRMYAKLRDDRRGDPDATN